MRDGRCRYLFSLCETRYICLNKSVQNIVCCSNVRIHVPPYSDVIFSTGSTNHTRRHTHTYTHMQLFLSKCLPRLSFLLEFPSSVRSRAFTVHGICFSDEEHVFSRVSVRNAKSRASGRQTNEEFERKRRGNPVSSGRESRSSRHAAHKNGSSLAASGMSPGFSRQNTPMFGPADPCATSASSRS